MLTTGPMPPRYIDSRELRERGWTYVSGVTSRSELLEVAHSVGRPVPGPNGEIVKELTPKPHTEFMTGNLTDTYGTGAFPLHTDTAFWPVPARYGVLRVRGDIRRPTTILHFAELFRERAEELRRLAEKSIWLMRTPSNQFYCSMRFLYQGYHGWRYDSQCMRPVNAAAMEAQEIVGQLSSSCRVECVNWRDDVAVVLCNWDVLHGRGPAPENEVLRTLERIYVMS